MKRQSPFYLPALTLFISLSLTACRDKDPIDDPFACEEEMGIFQTGTTADNYIKGTIDGRPFYYGDVNSNFINNSTIANETDGQGQPLTSFMFGLVDTLFLRYSSLPQINRPMFNFRFAVYTNKSINNIGFYDALFQPGEIRVINSDTPVTENSIGVVMDVSCDNNLFSRWKSISGSQPGSYFKITSVKREENTTSVTWTITADFEFTIYKDGLGKEIWDRVQDGELKTSVTVSK